LQKYGRLTSDEIVFSRDEDLVKSDEILVPRHQDLLRIDAVISVEDHDFSEHGGVASGRAAPWRAGRAERSRDSVGSAEVSPRGDSPQGQGPQ
jgi:hypothetical protein